MTHISKEDVNLSPEDVQGGVGFISEQFMINHGQTLIVSLQGQKTLHSEEGGEGRERGGGAKFCNTMRLASSTLLNSTSEKSNTEATMLQCHTMPTKHQGVFPPSSLEHLIVHKETFKGTMEFENPIPSSGN